MSNLSWGDEGENKRNTELFWLHPAPENYWIFDRISEIVSSVNEAYFKYDLYGYLRAAQVGLYNVGDGYDWHQDIGANVYSKRKLTISIELSNPDDYSGGQLQFFGTEREPEILESAIGSATVFPSWMMHRVTKVSEGTRWSMVLWIEGPPLR